MTVESECSFHGPSSVKRESVYHFSPFQFLIRLIQRKHLSIGFSVSIRVKNILLCVQQVAVIILEVVPPEQHNAVRDRHH